MKGKFKVYEVFVDMYEHLTLISPDKAGVDIRVGTAKEIQQQMQNGFTNLEKRFLIDRDQAKKSNKAPTVSKTTTPVDTNNIEVIEKQPTETPSVQEEPLS